MQFALHHIDLTDTSYPKPIQKLWVKIRNKEFKEYLGPTSIYSTIDCNIRPYPEDSEHMSKFNVCFTVPSTNSQYWTKANRIELFKLKWMYGKHWFQQDSGYGNLWKVINLIMGILGGLGLYPTLRYLFHHFIRQ